MAIQSLNLATLAPAAAEIYLLVAVCVVLLVDVFLSDRQRWVTFALSLLSLLGAAYVTTQFAVDHRVTAFSGMVGSPGTELEFAL